MKRCGRCKIEKEVAEFANCQFKRSGGRCRVCCTEAARKRKAKRTPEQIEKERIKQQEYDAKYYEENKEEILNYKQEYATNKPGVKEKRIQKEQNKLWNLLHPKEVKEKSRTYHNSYNKKKRKEDPDFAIKQSISANVNHYLNSSGLTKNGKSVRMNLPWTIEELWKHFAQYFSLPENKWMNKFNRGRYIKSEWDDTDPTTWKWQLDHIIPQSTFNYTDIDSEEFRACWALSNLRPLSAKQNQMDGATKIRHQQVKAK